MYRKEYIFRNYLLREMQAYIDQRNGLDLPEKENRKYILIADDNKCGITCEGDCNGIVPMVEFYELYDHYQDGVLSLETIAAMTVAFLLLSHLSINEMSEKELNDYVKHSGQVAEVGHSFDGFETVEGK